MTKNCRSLYFVSLCGQWTSYEWLQFFLVISDILTRRSTVATDVPHDHHVELARLDGRDQLRETFAGDFLER